MSTVRTDVLSDVAQTVSVNVVDIPAGLASGTLLRQDLLNSADPAKGAELVGYDGGTVRDRFQLLESRGGSAADLGAVGDGVVDDTAALIAARNAYGLVELESGKTYAISSQIAATADRQGFFCKGKATIKMLTGAGKFDRSSYTGSIFGANAVGIYCEGFNDYRLEGVAITMEATASIRCISAFALRNSQRSKVSVEAYGFKETERGITSFDSLTECDITAYVHDCGTSDNTLGTMQITAVNVDDVRIGGVATTNTKVHGYGKNVALTGAALATYGAQTDGVNCAGTGDNHGLEVISRWENVGEAFDCFGSFVKAFVQGKTIGAYGVKLVHGAQHCIVDAIIDSTAGAAVVLGGSNTASQDVAFNHITCTASNVGVIASALTKAAFHIDGPSATFKPRNNYIKMIVEGNAATTNAVSIESGSNNVVEFSYSGTQQALQSVVASSAGTGNIVRRLDSNSGSYAAGRYYGGGSISLSVTTTLALAANTLYAIPFEVKDNFRATLIGVFISTAVAGNARLGVYRFQKGAPTDLILDVGTISTGSTGTVETSINGGNGLTLTTGMYALAIVSNATPTIYASGASVLNVNSIGVGLPGTADVQMSRGFTYGALPSTFGTPTYSAALLPNIWLRG